ncbi:MAG: hypothetical protein LRY63_12080 [Nitrincola sp.]|nr:hypothetical protein [Nitrincola sp.]
MISQGLLFFTPLLPLILAALCCLEKLKRFAGYMALVAVLPAFILSLINSGQIELTWLSMPAVLMGSVWQVHPIGNTFLLFTAILWFFSALYAIGYTKKDDKPMRFWILWLLTLSGT